MDGRTLTAVLFAALLTPFSGSGVPATGDPAEPERFFRRFAGLNDDQILQIRNGKAVAKIVDSPTADQVFVFGSVYINSTPEQYIKFAADLDELRKLPNYLALRKFSDPPQLPEGFTMHPQNARAAWRRSIARIEEPAATSAFKAKMQTEEAQQIYSLRSRIAEFAHAWIKERCGLRQFRKRSANTVS